MLRAEGLRHSFGSVRALDGISFTLSAGRTLVLFGPKIPTDQAKAEVRKNRALLVGTLKELDVQIREAP